MRREQIIRLHIPSAVVRLCSLSLAGTMLLVPLSFAAPANTQQVPQPPSNLSVDYVDRTIRWQDNSDNEDGFRIRITSDFEVRVGPPSGSADVFEVDENQGELAIEDLSVGLSVNCLNVFGLLVEVAAFNEAGESSQASAWIVATPDGIRCFQHALFLSPASGTMATEIKVSGSGWPPGSAVEITVAEGGSPNWTTAGEVTVEDTATFRLHLIPRQVLGSKVSPSSLTIRAVVVNPMTPETDGLEETGTFLVGAEEPGLQPPGTGHGPPGSSSPTSAMLFAAVLGGALVLGSWCVRTFHVRKS